MIKKALLLICSTNFVSAQGFDVHAQSELLTAEGAEIVGDNNNRAVTGLVQLAITATKQSSVFGGATADRANDRNTSGYWSDKSIASTEINREAWWSADLGSLVYIDQIQLWNRTEGSVGDRLTDFYILVSDHPFRSTDLQTTLGYTDVWSRFHSGAVGQHVTVPVKTHGRHVRIQLQGTDYLSLAEVIVFGSPPSLLHSDVAKRALNQNVDVSTVEGTMTVDSSVLDLFDEDREYALGRIAFSQGAPIRGISGTENRVELIDLLLDSIDASVVVIPPAWTLHYPQPIEKEWPMGDEMRRLYKEQRNSEQRIEREQLKLWWLEQIAVARSPVSERLLLFWHDFFTTEVKTIPAQLVWRQQMKFRQHLLGSYDDLLSEMVRDPALLRYLDNYQNRKGNPNENFARELMELYSLGEGQYSEADVKELARALTGASLNWRDGTYQFNKHHHDNEDKNVLGETGPLKPDDIKDILLSKDRAAEYLIERLWESYISLTPDEDSIKQLAVRFREKQYSLRFLLREIWLHPAFWAAENRNALTQSPIEFVVNQYWSNGISLEVDGLLLNKLKAMGQDPFDPPDVGGWPEGQDWINSSKLSLREQFRKDLASRYSFPFVEPNEMEYLK